MRGTKVAEIVTVVVGVGIIRQEQAEETLEDGFPVMHLGTALAEAV